MFFNDPEEAQRAVEMQEMASEGAKHKVLDFMQELTEDQLESLSIMIFAMAQNDGGDVIAAHYHGMLKQILHFKFGRCGCGKVHDAPEGISLSPMTDAQAEEVKAKFSSATRPEIKEPPEDREYRLRLEENQLPDMKKYRLVRTERGHLACADCGISYVSLVDRMINPPEECHGCFLKSGHG